jgi:S1-C subfamily serine protease
MTQAVTTGPSFLETLSNELASAVDSVAGSVARVEARRGNASSGIVWSGDGQILTADHAVEREEDIRVHLGDGRSTQARLVARDPGSDLALLKVEATDLAPAQHAPEESIRVGSLVMAVGRPGPAGTMATIGIVSAVGGAWRTARGSQLESFVRTDATLYPGFSGGPLVDASGRVVGINSWTLSQGAGLAVPVSVAARLAQALAQGGVKRGFLGVGTQVVPLPQALRDQLGGQETGLIVLSLVSGGPAENGGLLIGDVLVGLEGQQLSDAEDLQSQLTPERVGKPAQLRVVRGGELRDVTITLGQRD